MKVYSVTDDCFKKYGKIVKGIDFSSCRDMQQIISITKNMKMIFT